MNEYEEGAKIMKKQQSKRKSKIMKAKIMFDRGRTWQGYVQFLMILFLAIQGLKKYVWFKDINTGLLLVVGFLGANILLFIIGYIEIKYLKTFQEEMRERAMLNPVIQEQMDILRFLKSKMGGDRL